MSITAAFGAALSGLTATSRQSEVLASNVANASTPGYAPRSVGLSARALGGFGQGVEVTGILRATNLVLTNDRRAATSDFADSQTRANFLSRLEDIFGTTEDASSIPSRINVLHTALISAASHPESEARLGAAVIAADQLANALKEASDAIQAERMAADRAIASSVETLNRTIQHVHELNIQITALRSAGNDPSALMDLRSAAIDSISELIPLHEVDRSRDQVALIANGGAVLLDGIPSKVAFTATRTIVAEMTLDNGALSGLTVNDRSMATSGPTSLIKSGKISALFAVRDELAVTAQSQLDGLARDMIERFSDTNLDSSLSAGAPGLFTDAGHSFNALTETGLAGRVAVNSALKPAAGGAVWRLRDGIGAATPGAPGNSSLLTSLATRLADSRATGSPALSTGNRSLPSLAGEILTSISMLRVAGDASQAYSAGRLSTLHDTEAANGVNVDAEMQALLVIEKNYAANAKVLQALDEMLGTLLGI